MPNGTLNVHAAMQRLRNIADRDQAGDETKAEARTIVNEWQAFMGNDPTAHAQISNAVSELRQTLLPQASRAAARAGRWAESNALERAIDELSKY
jgi:chemotaxis regulatin CheY-phosphate phosphatase CheZ